MVRAVRVFWGVAVRMVHPVEHRIGPRGEVRTSLTDPGKYVEESFPEFGHGKHLVGSIPVKEEALAE